MVQPEKQNQQDTYWKIYCKELTYMIVGAGKVSLKSTGQDFRKGRLELCTAENAVYRWNYLFIMEAWALLLRLLNQLNQAS